MLNRNFILRSLSGILTKKSSDSAPMSASVHKRAHRDQKDAKLATAGGAINRALRSVMGAKIRTRMLNKNGRVRSHAVFTRSRTGPLPADIFPEAVLQHGKRSEEEMSNSQRQLRQARRAHNPLAAAQAVATASAPRMSYEAPWLTLKKKFLGKSSVASSMYNQRGLEGYFGTDPLDTVAVRLNTEVLVELHAKTPHPINSPLTQLKWNSVRHLSVCALARRNPSTVGTSHKIGTADQRSNSGNASILELSTTALSSKRFLKIPAWPLAALVLDNNSAQNASYRNLPQHWADLATGDADVAPHTTLHTSSSAPADRQSMSLADLSDKANKYFQKIDAAAVLGQPPTSILYQLQAFSSLGMPMIGMDKIFIVATLDNWHSFKTPVEQLVVLRAVVHLAMTRVSVENDLLDKSGRDSDDATSPNEPVGGEESIAAIGQFLLQTCPSFPRKLSQTVPLMLKYLGSRGLLLDYFEVLWHWQLWMGGGLPDAKVIEAADESTSKLAVPNQQKHNTTDEANFYWGQLVAGNATQNLQESRRAAVLGLYPNTVSDTCTRSAGFYFWSQTCGLSGDNITEISKLGGAIKREETNKAEDNSWFKPVYSGLIPSVTTSLANSVTSRKTRNNGAQQSKREADALRDLPLMCSLYLDRPVLFGLHAPLMLATEVLRDMWDRSPPAPGAIPIPFHRRVRTLEWSQGMLVALHQLHTECTVDGREDKDEGHNDASTILERSATGAGNNKVGTSDLSAKLAGAAGELLDTLVDITEVVNASNEIQSAKNANCSSFSESSTGKTLAIVTPATDDDPSMKVHLATKLLPSVVKLASTFFTDCCEELLDKPVEVSPFTHIAVMDAVRAHQELVALHEDLIKDDGKITLELTGEAQEREEDISPEGEEMDRDKKSDWLFR